jgi:hypothetical protein
MSSAKIILPNKADATTVLECFCDQIDNDYRPLCEDYENRRLIKNYLLSIVGIETPLFDIVKYVEDFEVWDPNGRNKMYVVGFLLTKYGI